MAGDGAGQYRDTKLAIVDEAKTADGRPDWRAAAWALAKAFPEDYGRSAAPAAPGVAEGRFPDPEELLKMGGPTLADFGALLEENEALRTQLRSLLP